VTALAKTLNAGLASLPRKGDRSCRRLFYTKLYASSRTIAIAAFPLTKGTMIRTIHFTFFQRTDSTEHTLAGVDRECNPLAFNTAFKAGIKPLTGTEIMRFLESQHGVTMDAGYSSWTLPTVCLRRNAGHPQATAAECVEYATRLILPSRTLAQCRFRRSHRSAARRVWRSPTVAMEIQQP